MKTENKIILYSFVLGFFVLILEDLIEFLVFHQRSLSKLSIMEIPAHEIYIDTFVLLCFFFFGFICGRIVVKEKKIKCKSPNILI